MLDAITVNFWTPSKPLGIYLFLERSGGETLFWKSLKFRFSKLVIVIYVYKKISECHVFATIWKKFHDFSLISETLLFGNTMSRIFFKIERFFSVSKFSRWRIIRSVVSSEDFYVHLIQFVLRAHYWVTVNCLPVIIRYPKSWNIEIIL